MGIAWNVIHPLAVITIYSVVFSNLFPSKPEPGAGHFAWTQRNVDLVRERARLITQFFIKEDRDAVMLELAELHRIHEAEPNLHMFPGHDAIVLADALKSGLLIDKFK